MKKNVFFLLAFLFLTTLLPAQTAQQWMDKVSENYKKIPTYYIKFDLKESGNPKTFTGELFAARERYSLDVMDIKQMYDGKTLYTVSKEDKEVTVSNPTPESDDLLTPTKILNMYKSGFQMALGKTETIGGEKIQFIKLTPTGNSEIESVLVGVNVKNNSLQQYKEFYKNGSSRLITVKEYLENLIIPRALFKFDQSKYEKDGYIVTSI
ncbi:MAG TPA: outer membrane lipoprotein carrier protein LolA [Moheibacter sp.]|nr:outer membrane lipoprotein carrier protein LolA [Moheibacter sp.]